VIGFVQFDTSYTAAVAFLVVAVLSIIVTYALRRTELVR
jgi:multiple sugar transport system permease protein